MRLLEKVRKRGRSYSIMISLELLENIKKVCVGDISTSSFIKLAVVRELRRRGIEMEEPEISKKVKRSSRTSPSDTHPDPPDQPSPL